MCINWQVMVLQNISIDEKHLVAAQSPYAASKIAADQIALSYHKSFNVPVSILRPFNTFGPRQSLRAISDYDSYPSFE